MTSKNEKINKEKYLILNFQCSLLKKIFNLYKKNNDYIYLYLENIEEADSEILKIKMKAIYSLKRKGIFKNFKVLSDKKKKDILKIEQPIFDKLDIAIQDLNKHDILKQNIEYIENEFFYRLDVPCVYLKLKKTDIDLKKAAETISNPDPGFFKSEKTKKGKVVIHISKIYGVYSNSFTKEFIHYAINKKAKRFDILNLLLSTNKAVGGTYISKKLNISPANLSNEIKKINLLFKRNLILNKELITRGKPSGYILNYPHYHIIKDD